MKIPTFLFVAAIAAIQVFATRPAGAAEVPEALKTKVIETYASIGSHSTADAQTQAEALKKAVAEFTAAPSAESLKKAKQAWIAARLPYLQAEVFRHSPGGEEVDAFDPSTVDSLKEKPKSGIVNDAAKYPDIDKIVVGSLGEKSTGFAAIEFLLWGEDLDIEGPGQRSFEDFVKAKSAAAPRRAAFVNACAELVADQATAEAAAWKAGDAENLRGKLLAMPTDEALAKIFSAIADLSGKELSAKRIGRAYESRKNETSDFSDTSHLDVMYGSSGIANVVAGAYVGTDKEIKVRGAGLLQLAEALGEKQGTSLKLATNNTMLAVREFRPPLDRALIAPDTSPAREAVKEIIDSLAKFSQAATALAKELGLKVEGDTEQPVAPKAKAQ